MAHPRLQSTLIVAVQEFSLSMVLGGLCRITHRLDVLTDPQEERGWTPYRAINRLLREAMEIATHEGL